LTPRPSWPHAQTRIGIHRAASSGKRVIGSSRGTSKLNNRNDDDDFCRGLSSINIG
jgi:hypothetical protein